VLENGQVVSRTDYAGSWVYEQDSLAFVHAAEGRLVPDAQSGQLEREYFYTDHLGNLRLVWKKGEELVHLTAEPAAHTQEQQKVVENLNDLRNTEQMYEGEAGLLLAPNSSLEGAGRTALNGSSLLHISLYTKAGVAAEPAAGMSSSSLRIQEEPNFSFGEEIIRYNPVAAPVGAESNSRLDRVSFNLPALVRAAGSIGRNNPPQLQGDNGQRWQPVQEPVFSTLRTTEPVEDCQPGSFYLHITSYDSLAEPIATKTLYLSSYCHWDSTNLKIKLPEGAEQVSWRLENSGSQLYVDEFKLTTVEIPQENHYYAFGLDMAGVSKTAANSHSYTYNGKELQAETGWHDYGARMYDAQISRWGAVDSMAEVMRRHSVFNYAFNNPIRFIDPDGMMPTDPCETGDCPPVNDMTGWENPFSTAEIERIEGVANAGGGNVHTYEGNVNVL
jgi:RHS repeat-associated protein